MTTTCANLAAHWQWRYSRLEDDYNHTYDLLIPALADVQSDREVTHALLDALHDANKLAKRRRDTMNRLRKERHEGQKSWTQNGLSTFLIQLHAARGTDSSTVQLTLGWRDRTAMVSKGITPKRFCALRHGGPVNGCLH